MKKIKELTKEDIKDIKIIVFDVDGVLVPRGTKISQNKNVTSLETKKIGEREIKNIEELFMRGYLINISSGRGLYMLQEMFREVLSFVSLTYENGSCTWENGRVIQHINPHTILHEYHKELKKIKHKNIKGFEPKEHIITIHAKDRVHEIEKLMNDAPGCYCIWNGEAYDIGVNNQTKAKGLEYLKDCIPVSKEEVMAIGDNYNDVELLEEAGLPISADKSRVKGKFYTDNNSEVMPASQLMEAILKCL